jgi:hypothetical protein
VPVRDRQKPAPFERACLVCEQIFVTWRSRHVLCNKFCRRRWVRWQAKQGFTVDTDREIIRAYRARCDANVALQRAAVERRHVKEVIAEALNDAEAIEPDSGVQWCARPRRRVRT